MIDISIIEAGSQTRTPNPAPRRKRPWPRRARRGVGLPGAVLALVIAAIVLGATFVIFGNTNDNFRTQETLTRMGLMESSIRRTYANQPQYGGALTNGLLSKMPGSAIQEDGTRSVAGMPSGEDRRIVTPWGGLIVAGGGDTPRANGNGTDSGNRFFIVVLELPEQACENIAASFLNRSSVVDVRAKDGSTGNFGGGTIMADVAAIETACDGGDTNAVAIVFRG